MRKRYQVIYLKLQLPNTKTRIRTYLYTQFNVLCYTILFLKIHVGSSLLPIARTFLKMRSDVCYLQLKNVMAKDPAKLLIQVTMGQEIIREG